MGDSRAGQLVRQIRDFIAKVLKDPSTVTRNPAEANAATTAVKLLAQLLPGVPQTAAAEFERFIRDLASNPKLREAVATQVQPQFFGGVFSDPMMQLPPLPATGDPSAQDMVKYQQEMQKYTMMMQMLSNIMQIQHDTMKNVIQNIRA